MTYRLIYTSSFKKDVRLAKKRHLDMNALTEVLEWLKSGKKLPRKILRPPAERETEEIPGAAHSAGLDSGLHKEQDGTDSYAFTHRNSC